MRWSYSTSSALVDAKYDEWRLTVDGNVAHGSNAVVVPARRSRQRAVLRLAPPGDAVSIETAALAHWRGRGVVQLLDVDLEGRACCC